MSDNRTTAIFDEAFSRFARDLTGTEAEIVVYKKAAKHWFDLGMSEAAARMHGQTDQALRNTRAALDSDWDFKNHIR